MVRWWLGECIDCVLDDIIDDDDDDDDDEDNDYVVRGLMIMIIMRK